MNNNNNKLQCNIFGKASISPSHDTSKKEGAATRHCQKMFKEIETLEGNSGNISVEDFRNQKYALHQRFFEEIAKEDTIYGKILAKILDSFKEKEKFTQEQFCLKISNIQKENDFLKESLNNQKKKYEKLEKENIEMASEYEKQSALIDSQKIMIKTLKKEVSEKTTISDSENTESGKAQIQKLMSEIGTLYKENTRVSIIAQKLQNELKQAKVRELTLVKMLKGSENKEADKNVKPTVLQEKKNEENKGMSSTEKKIIIPKLDFSKLPQKKPCKITVVPCDSTSSIENSSKLESENSIFVLF